MDAVINVFWLVRLAILMDGLLFLESLLRIIANLQNIRQQKVTCVFIAE